MASKQKCQTANFPAKRMRRLRRSKLVRDFTADVNLELSNLVLPLFVGEMDKPIAVESMDGVYQWPVDSAVEKIKELSSQGLKSFLLFGVTKQSKKDDSGSFAASLEAPVNRVLTKVREQNIDALMIADLCFCEYTNHGHCGILKADAKNLAGQNFQSDCFVNNDATLAQLGITAVAQAKAGADVVAPSAMVDGQVQAIRSALDKAGFSDTAILSYSVKYASSFYGPFREAGGGQMQFGSRAGYQMDFRRSFEWQDELKTDLNEGADMVMVKPALAYLDILSKVREVCNVPIGAYHVSGEYAMICAAAQKGWLELKPTALEATYAMRRAGADLIITYFAENLIEWLKTYG